MSQESKNKLIKGYEYDGKLYRTYRLVSDNEKLNNKKTGTFNAADIPWRLTKDGFLLLVNKTTELERPCVSKSCIKDIFELVHGEHHPDFQACFDGFMVHPSSHKRTLMCT